MKYINIVTPNIVCKYLGDTTLVIDNETLVFASTINKYISKIDNYLLIDFKERKLSTDKNIKMRVDTEKPDIQFAILTDVLQYNNIERTILLNIDYLLLYSDNNFVQTLTRYLYKISSLTKLTVSVSQNSIRFFEQYPFFILFDTIVELLDNNKMKIKRSKDLNLTNKIIPFSYIKSDTEEVKITNINGVFYLMDERVEITDEKSEKTLYDTLYETLSHKEFINFFKRWVRKYFKDIAFPKTNDIRSIINTLLKSTTLFGNGNFEVVSISDNKIILKGHSLFPEKISYPNTPIHYFYTFSLEEILMRTTGDKWVGRETMCTNKGDPYCLFEIERIHSTNQHQEDQE